MKKLTILFAALLLMSVSLFAKNWTPDLKYAKWVSLFGVDKTFKFNGYVPNNRGALDDGVSKVDFPGTIAWSFMAWDTHNDAGSDYNMYWFELYLRNGHDGTGENELMIAHLDMGREDNDHWPTKITNYNDNHSYFVQSRWYHCWDGCHMNYMVTEYSGTTREFIEKAGDNLYIVIKTEWDTGKKDSKDVMNVFHIASANPVEEGDRTFMAKPSYPQINDVQWTVKDGKTALQYTHTVANECEFFATEILADKSWSISTSGSALSVKDYAYPFEQSNKPSASDMFMAPISYGYYAMKGYTMNQKFYGCRNNRSGGWDFWDLGFPSSSTSVSSGRKAFKTPSFAQAKNFMAVDHNDGTIKLTWSVDKAPDGLDVDESAFVLERADNPEFTGTIKSVKIPFKTEKDSLDYAYVSTFTERNVGKKTFYFRIHREHAAVKDLSTTKSVIVNTNYASLASFSARVANQKVLLSWKISEGMLTPDLKLRLQYNAVNKDFELSDVSNLDKKDYEISDGLPTCDSIRFTVQVYDNTKAIGETKSITLLISNDMEGNIKSYHISKGYYNDRTLLRWDVNEQQYNFSFFQISRRRMNSGEAPITVATVDYIQGVFDYSYEDTKCIPGVYYDYFISGYSTCGEVTAKMHEVTAIGFAQPYGIVSGNVSHVGNQGVADVAIRASIPSTVNNESRTRSLKFLAKNNAALTIPKELLHQMIGDEGTIEFFMKNVGPGRHAVIATNDMAFALFVENNTFIAGGNTYNLNEGQFTHISITFKDKTLYVYANAELVFTGTNSQTCFTGKGFVLGGNGFEGFIDEIRVWNICRSPEEIKRTMNGYLVGNELGLTGYYRCDDAIEGALYDLSQTGLAFNEHHLTTVNIPTDPDNIPSPEQLSYLAYTDQDGDYMINNIPYSDGDNGTLYEITPSLGTHSFGPRKRNLTFSRTYATHNSINFTDSSSFTVEGTVMFYNTEYPVKGCQLYVDGQLCTEGGRPIESNDKGQFSIQVPIGQHYITIKKDGHTFCEGGRFPTAGTYNFVENISTLEFVDSTMVLVVGRVAGGDDERIKAHGMGLGNANIGQAQIVLTPPAFCNLNTTDKTRIFTIPDSVYCNSVTSTQKKGGEGALHVTILTDPLTGEFAALLPPIDYEITSIEIPSNKEIEFDLGQYPNLPLGSVDIHRTHTDSAFVDSVTIKKITYLQAFDVIYYALPELTVSQNNNNYGALGERTYFLTLPSGMVDTVPLYNKDNHPVTYTMGVPCFMQNKTYSWTIKAFETYVNKDSVPNKISYQPMRNAIVTIENAMGQKELAREDGYYVGEKGDSMSVVMGQLLSLESNQLILDEAGEANYVFTVGEPNILPPYTYGVTITYSDLERTRYYSWSENETFQGLILGALTSGTNFVTQGPDQLLFVLRDPPGGQSYSTWEQGETITTTLSSSRTDSESTDIFFNTNLGISTTIATGAAVGAVAVTVLEVSTKDDVGTGDTNFTNKTRSTSDVYEVTTNKTISTQPGYPAIGTPGDVFVGVGTNVVFGNARKVDLQQGIELGTYDVILKDVISTGSTFSTSFDYTTSDIEGNVIPNYKKMRNSLLQQVSPAEYKSTYPNTTGKPIYITTLSKDDPRFGSDNHDKSIWGSEATSVDSLGGPSYIMVLPSTMADSINGFVDEVCMYNNQVRRWLNILADNEQAKVAVHHSSKLVNWDQWDDAVDKAALANSYRSRLSNPTLDEAEREALKAEAYALGIDTALVQPSDYYNGGWLIENISMGGSVTVSSSRTRTSGKGTSSRQEDGYKGSLKASNGTSVNSFGFSLTAETTSGTTDITESSQQITTKSTVGYTLAPNNYEYMSIDVYAAPDGFGPIFSTRGGQTYCPYEDEEMTKYFEPGLHELHSKTVSMEDPYIEADVTTITDIPLGSKAYYTLTLSNIADVNPEHYYWLKLYAAGDYNPNGAQITVDGAYLTDDGRSFMFHPGSPIVKTLAIAQSDPAILDYDSIAIVLASDCNRRDDADTVYLSAHFVPTCTPIKLSINQMVVNSSTGDSLPIIIRDYDRNFRNFKSIRLQYHRIGDNDWHLIHEFCTLPQDTVEGKTLITGPIITYSLDMVDTQFPDGTYEFRAVTTCAYGNEDVINESEVITVIKDMQKPQSLGLPSPINGIYTADNQIYVEFNEPIQTGRIHESNIAVTGALNAQPIQHDVAYRLSANQTFVTQTDAHYDLTAQDFAFVCWLYLEKDGAIFSHNNGGFSVQTDTKGRLIVTLANKDATGIMPVRFRSNDTLPKNQWMYLAVMMNQTEGTINAYIAYDSYDICLLNNQSTTFVYNQRGAVAVGVQGQTMAQGAIHDLQLWTGISSWQSLKSMMYVTKELYRDNLYGYWPMTEGEGRVLHDKMRNRHMLAPGASWFYADDNYAARLPEGTTALVNISDRNMDELTDYALEFWFRTDADGTLVTTDAADYMRVGLEEGKPYVATLNGRINLPVDQSYNDGQWHHLAILSHHQDNAQVVLDDAILSLGTFGLTGLRGTQLEFGDTLSQTDIDEIRLWKASITAKWILDNRRARVTGDQPGLISYFPMEKRYISQGIEFYKDTLGDLATDTLYDHSISFSPVQEQGTIIPITDAPAMRVDKHAVSVKHSFVASDTKIVINVTEEPALIEGTTLNISVSDIIDMHGNYSPDIKWTAYVNRNRLVWGQDQMYIEKEVLASKSFNVTFSNLSGQSEDWMLENVPNYIQVSETGGTLRPQQTQTITFTVLPSLAVGYYDPIIYLVGNEAIRTPLSLNIHVTGDKPDWSVREEDYEYTMNLIGMPWATFMQPDTADMMAAFIGDQVAGVCHPQLLNPQTTTLFVMMDIYANLTQAEMDSINHNVPIHKPVTFRYWDASTGRVYVGVKTSIDNQPYTVNYQPNALIGNFDKPVLFDLDARIEQSVELRKGWNWYSFNVFPEATDIMTALPEMLPYINIMKSQEAFVKVDHAREALSGTLTEVDAYKLYKASSLADSTIHITGYPVDPLLIDIQIHKGWNWIGYVPQITLSVSMALSNMEPAEGDIIKARSGFAVWHNNAWIGSLTAMTPGHGYMYFSGSADTKYFHYPSYLASIPTAPQRLLMAENTDYHYSPISPSTYSGNMTMTAIVMNGVEQVTTAEVAFFAGDECRTTMKASNDDHYYFTIPGDETVVLHPRVWYNNEEYRPNQTFNFIEDADYGTFDNPIVIQLDPTTDLEGVHDARCTMHNGKFILNERLIIRKNGKTYNALGIEL